MNRITDNQLVAVVDRLNRITNNPPTYATREADGRFTIHIGNYHIDRAYGGCQLVQTVTAGGGVRDVLDHGHVTKRALYELMHAYLKGFDDGRESAQ